MMLKALTTAHSLLVMRKDMNRLISAKLFGPAVGNFIAVRADPSRLHSANIQYAQCGILGKHAPLLTAIAFMHSSI
ncbi:unnamed protein product [Rodentolepis nana]|uniref:tRNA-intron lyase n=1 Tax=Rodentolepis nana TaxID=102285 RepID=A0A0R3TRV2_RODNA|nr:unnamed protein product [Rodentolepis nana]